MSHQKSIHCSRSVLSNVFMPTNVYVLFTVPVSCFWRLVQVHKSCQKWQETFWAVNCLTRFSAFYQHSFSISLSYTHRHTRRLADDAVLLYFLMLECLCPMIIVNLIDAVTWSVMVFQVIAEAVWKKHRFFLRRKGASAELGLRKKHPFLISFSCPPPTPTTFLLKCKLANTSCAKKTWHIWLFLPLCEEIPSSPSSPCFTFVKNSSARATWQVGEHAYLIHQLNRKWT